MRCSILLPIALVVSASASLVLPFAASASWQITRRQDVSACSDECDTVSDQVTSCGTNQTCVCTVSLAKGLKACTACTLEADPPSAQMLQSALDQYATACANAGHSVGSLILSATGAASSTSSRASASITSTSAITSISTSPALATSASSFVASLSSATRSAVAVVSSSAPAALSNQPTVTPTDGLAGSGNGAAYVGAPMTGAFLVAGIVAAFAAL